MADPDQAARPRRRRWLAVVGVTALAVLGLVGVAAVAVTGPLGQVVGLGYRSFYIPSEAMMPTLLKNDRLMARMGRPAELRRGMIILFDVGDAVYVKRLAALPGDRVEFVGGDFFLNGQLVPRRARGEFRTANSGLAGPARLYSESLPGEVGSHDILDLGYSVGDDFLLRTVPPGHVFVLGDNRDQSADSRFSRAEMGAEMVPIDEIRGVALFIYWRAGEGFGDWPLAN